MTAPRCTCSIWANEPSRWCEKHRPMVWWWDADYLQDRFAACRRGYCVCRNEPNRLLPECGFSQNCP